MVYCSLGDENSRVLEVPLWMLDVAACSKTQVSKLGFVSTDSLRELKQVLEPARLRGASLEQARNAASILARCKRC